MTYIYSKLKVKDFPKWKEHFESLNSKRLEAGITEKYILRGIEDRNQVIMLLEVKDIARAKSYIESPFLKDAMKEGGVIGKPEFLFVDEEYGELAKVSGL